ncbi:hypothetical protein K470DRAFT_259854 [Piedraia hortae CBS 480.64]|uniref:Mating-type alpha-pheromone receptor PreB n=1 Tax=Piedraia hortae CBS 480.64 TaxID=1314780 RepID=A0A6A7BT62_9PEZI|nr:hypothetical protein K470DRAFT_259854 [Piedraia hortae CBS 480.64]
MSIIHFDKMPGGDQTFTLLSPAGTPFSASLFDISTVHTMATSQGILFGVQVGLTGMLLLLLPLTTAREKRKSPVFILNLVALALLLLRSTLTAALVNSIFYDFYHWVLGYFPPSLALNHAIRLGVSVEVTSALIDGVIYSSLILQVNIVCCTIRSIYRNAITSACVVVSLATMSFRVYFAIWNIRHSIVGINSFTKAQQDHQYHLVWVYNVLSVFTIALFAAIFVCRLAFTIRARRRLNIKQFGPMQIIFIVGCQTLLIPLTFAVAACYTLPGAQLRSMVPTVVAIFLPLSGLWAASQSATAKAKPPVHLNVLSSYHSKSLHSDETQNDTLVGDASFVDEESRIFEKPAGNIVLDKTYSVRSD